MVCSHLNNISNIASCTWLVVAAKNLLNKGYKDR